MCPVSMLGHDVRDTRADLDRLFEQRAGAYVVSATRTEEIKRAIGAAIGIDWEAISFRSMPHMGAGAIAFGTHLVCEVRLLRGVVVLFLPFQGDELRLGVTTSRSEASGAKPPTKVIGTVAVDAGGALEALRRLQALATSVAGTASEKGYGLTEFGVAADGASLFIGVDYFSIGDYGTSRIAERAERKADGTYEWVPARQPDYVFVRGESTRDWTAAGKYVMHRDRQQSPDKMTVWRSGTEVELVCAGGIESSDYAETVYAIEPRP